MNGMRSWLVVGAVIAGACNNGGDDDIADCTPYIGTYAGTLAGASPFSGTITLVVSNISGSTMADLEGTWTGQNGYRGEINRADLECKTGSVDYDFGMSLSGPTSVTCPPPCAPGSSSGGCYCTGLTLGPFAGTMSPTDGSGTFTIDSGAAASKGIAMSSGTWTVTRN